jgi:hypothetical protein
MTTPPLPEQIELHRDRMWRRDEDLRIESAVDAERFIEDVGFANTLTDTRRAGASLYSESQIASLTPILVRFHVRNSFFQITNSNRIQSSS